MLSAHGIAGTKRVKRRMDVVDNVEAAQQAGWLSCRKIMVVMVKGFRTRIHDGGKNVSAIGPLTNVDSMASSCSRISHQGRDRPLATQHDQEFTSKN